MTVRPIGHQGDSEGQGLDGVQAHKRGGLGLPRREIVRLAHDAPEIAFYEGLALGHSLLRERHLLAGYRDARRLASRARARRRAIQSRRRVDRVPFGLAPER